MDVPGLLLFTWTTMLSHAMITSLVNDIYEGHVTYPK